MSAGAIYQHTLGLRVTRAYRDEPLSAEHLNAILDAGRWTGSSKNVQGWMFIVVTDSAELERVASAGTFTDPLRGAAAGIALVSTPEGNDFDIGRTAQNMMLAADALGVGSCPITLHDAERSAEVLGLPAGHRCRWVISLGYPDEEREALARQKRRDAGIGGRKPMDEIVRRGLP